MSRLSFALPFALLACSASSPSGVSPAVDAQVFTDLPASSTCIPGAQMACACPGGAASVQVCGADGRSLGACQCAADAAVAVDVPAAPVDAGACGAGVTDPALDTTSCAAPTGSPRPYFQCATGTLCPRARFANDPQRPGFRVTYFDIAQPVALANAAILNTLNPALAQGAFLWGITFDLTANTFRTGALNSNLTRGTVGLGLMDGHFAFFNDDGPAGMSSVYNPAAGALTVAGGLVSTAAIPTTVNLRVVPSTSQGVIIQRFPLDNASLTGVQLTADRGCIGGGLTASGRYTESTSRWSTVDGCGTAYATINANITVDNAKASTVTIGGSPIALCNIISGANCESDAMSTWSHQPDSTVNGAPAWHFRATFAAISADIAP